MSQTYKGDSDVSESLIHHQIKDRYTSDLSVEHCLLGKRHSQIIEYPEFEISKGALQCFKDGAAVTLYNKVSKTSIVLEIASPDRALFRFLYCQSLKHDIRVDSNLTIDYKCMTANCNTSSVQINISCQDIFLVCYWAIESDSPCVPTIATSFVEGAAEEDIDDLLGVTVKFPRISGDISKFYGSHQRTIDMIDITACAASYLNRVAPVSNSDRAMWIADHIEPTVLADIRLPVCNCLESLIEGDSPYKDILSTHLDTEVKYAANRIYNDLVNDYIQFTQEH